MHTWEECVLCYFWMEYSAISQSDLMCHVRLMFHSDFLPGYLSINVYRILKSLEITVLLSISPFRSFDICYIYICVCVCVCAPMLKVWFFINVMSSYWIDILSLFSIILCLLLQLLFENLFFLIGIAIQLSFGFHLHGTSLSTPLLSVCVYPCIWSEPLIDSM